MTSNSSDQPITGSSLDRAISLVKSEIAYSRTLHPPMANLYHAHGVIVEELEEFWDSVKSNSMDINEIAQVAACLVMTIEDVLDQGMIPDEDLLGAVRQYTMQDKFFTYFDPLYYWSTYTIPNLDTNITPHVLYSVLKHKLESVIYSCKVGGYGRYSVMDFESDFISTSDLFRHLLDAIVFCVCFISQELNRADQRAS